MTFEFNYEPPPRLARPSEAIRRGGTDRRARVRHSLAAILTLWTLIGAHSAVAQVSASLRQNFWTIDGPVLSVLETNGFVYVGGQFTNVGPFTGGAAALDATTGTLLPNFPVVNGTVAAVVSDGKDGWFLGGDFAGVGGVAATNLVHLQRQNVVDPNWTPNPNGPVLALLVIGNTLYAGGTFDHLGGQPRPLAGAVDATTGQTTAWNPTFQGARVSALANWGTTIYAGGSFSVVGHPFQEAHGLKEVEAIGFSLQLVCHG